MFCKKISKTDKDLARLTNKKKKEKTPVTNFRNKTRDIGTDPIDITRIIRRYYENFKGINLINEMDQFLEKQKLSQLTHVKHIFECSYSYVGNWICNIKIPINKRSDLDAFTGAFYQIVKRKIKKNSTEFLLKNKKEGNTSNSFYVASITMMSKP